MSWQGSGETKALDDEIVEKLNAAIDAFKEQFHQRERVIISEAADREV